MHKYIKSLTPYRCILLVVVAFLFAVIIYPIIPDQEGSWTLLWSGLIGVGLVLLIDLTIGLNRPSPFFPHPLSKEPDFTGRKRTLYGEIENILIRESNKPNAPQTAGATTREILALIQNRLR